MIYIREQDKENVHLTIMHNHKNVQFSDKLKRYNNDTLTFSSDNSCQATESKQNHPQKALIQNQSTSQQPNHRPHQPEVSHFDIDELHHISKQISLKDVSRIYSKRQALSKSKVKKQWVKSILEPSKAELKLLQKIESMLEKQNFKPTYSSTISQKRKYCHSNTMNTDEKLIMESISRVKQSVQHSKNSSPGSNNKSNLSDLISFSRLSGISSKTLEKYLLCLEKEKLNEMQKSQKVSEFSLIDTQRSKQLKNQQVQQKNRSNKSESNEIQKKAIFEIYSFIKSTANNKDIDSINPTTERMLQQIKTFILKTLGKVAKQQDSTCLLQD